MSIRVGLRHFARVLGKILKFPKGEYPGVDVLGGYINMAQWPGITVLANPNQIYLMFDGISVLGGTSDLVIMEGITVEVGTP